MPKKKTSEDLSRETQDDLRKIRPTTEEQDVDVIDDDDADLYPDEYSDLEDEDDDDD
jgi:hypothetical protein